jgi:methylase of polypeptide subunit release factors
MKDILGKALLDFHAGDYTEDIITETSISEEDELPLPYLFRSFNEMPSLEKTAINNCFGNIIDIGCGAGSHSLALQEKGLHVTAIDISPGAIEVCTKRDIKNSRCVDVLDISEEKYDTLLLLMNGTGIFQDIHSVSKYLTHLKTLLTPNGQILIDSSDLKYMYDTTEEGAIWVPGNKYYGELTFTMSYKGEQTEEFYWLYLDEALFEKYAIENGFNFEILERGDHYDYLAKLTLV